MKKVLAVFLTLFFSASTVFAQSFSSPNYQLQDTDIGVGAVDPTSAGSETRISSKLGAASAIQFARDGYLAWLGFGHIESEAPFTFTISNVATTTSTELIVGFGAVPSYQVSARETDVLKTLNDNLIENTKCDRGRTCSATIANVWALNSTYGFGYNLKSEKYPNTIPGDFLNEKYFRPFASLAAGQDPVVIMSKPPFDRKEETTNTATMTLKVNVPENQTVGTYSTIIELTAVPPY